MDASQDGAVDRRSGLAPVAFVVLALPLGAAAWVGIFRALASLF